MVDKGHWLRGHYIVFRDGEQWGLLEGQTPLNRTQDEQFGPGLFKQCYLKKIAKKTIQNAQKVAWLRKKLRLCNMCVATWSLNGKLAKDVRFFVHLTAIKSNLAQISWLFSWTSCDAATAAAVAAEEFCWDGKELKQGSSELSGLEYRLELSSFVSCDDEAAENAEAPASMETAEAAWGNLISWLA
jgi:hypothetical protein